MYSTTLPFARDLPPDVPFAWCLQRVMGHRAPLVGHADPRGLRDPLAALLAIAVFAKRAGASRVEAVADWVSWRAPELARLFGLPRPTMPHARTWGRIFAHAVDPITLE